MDSIQDVNLEKLKAEFKKQIIERDKRARQEKLKSATAVLVVTLIGLIISFVAVVNQDKVKPPTPLESIRYDQIKTELSSLKSQVEALKPSTSSGIANLESGSVAKLEARLSALEAAILDNPEKALSLPLVRKDLNEISKREAEYRTSLKSEIDRLYEQQKWMLGGIGTVLLAVAGGAISILFRSAFRSRNTSDE